MEKNTKDDNFELDFQDEAQQEVNDEPEILGTLIEEVYKNEKMNIDDEEVHISEEDYLLECSRFNDIDGVNDVLSCGVVKLNYQDSSLNSALRKSFILIIKIWHPLMETLKSLDCF